MISIICVYNDEATLKENLVSSLKKQDTDYELILVDNAKNNFRSLPRSPRHRYYRSIWRVNELRNKGYKVHGLILRTRFQNAIGEFFDYVAKLISWYQPRISGILVAVKKGV